MNFSAKSKWRPGFDLRTSLCIIVGLALVSLVYFDLGPPLAFNDDWVYAWSARQLAAGRGIVLFPAQAVEALVQIVWGAIATFGNPDYRLLRLSQVPFVLLAAWSVYRLSRLLGADRTWSIVAVGSLICCPIYLALATSFMSDGFYLALMLAALASAAQWVKNGKERGLCVVLVGLATLERQHGVLLVVPLGAALLSGAVSGHVRKSDLFYLAAAIGVPLASVLVPQWLGWTTPTMSDLSASPSIDPVYLLSDASWAIAIAGLLLLPFLVALSRPRVELTQRRAAILLFALLGVGGIFAWQLGEHQLLALPGNYLSIRGLNPVSLVGPKQLYPTWLFLDLEILAVVAAAIFMVRCVAEIRLSAAAAEWVLLGGAAATQLLPLGLSPDIFDRYLLPVAVPFLPMAAVMATRLSISSIGRTWAVFALAAGLAIYWVGEQDHQAWQAARDSAAQMIYRCFPADRIQAGFEANGVYVELPAFEQSGALSGSIPTIAGANPAAGIVAGPADPAAVLQFSSPQDRSPGVSYDSFAPGKVVIVLRQAAPAGCDLGH